MERLLNTIGKQDLAKDARFATPQARAEHALDIAAVLGPWCRERHKIEVMDSLQRAGVPAGAVFDTGELVKDPELRKSGVKCGGG